MRLRLYAVLCVLAIAYAGAQEAGAIDATTTTGASAYDILGVTPAPEPAATLVQASTTENVPAAPAAQPVATTEAAMADVEVSGDQPVPPAPEATDATLAEPASEAASDGASAEPDDEAALMAEIMRLLAERDTLYQTINDLREENNTLVAQMADYEYYKKRSAELETEIARLEGVIQEKDVALAAADARLAEIEAKLTEEGSRRADAEAKLAEQNLAIEAVKRELAEAKARLEADRVAAQATTVPQATTVAPVTTAASESVSSLERRLAAMIAERDAAIAVRDSAMATRDAAEMMTKASEASRIEAEAALATALTSGIVVRAAASVAPAAGYLSGWKLDTSRFAKKLRTGFDGSASRIGSWRIAGATASQADASQYFSRLEMPLPQTKVATLYRFKARSTGSGWIGLGLHLFVEDIRKKRGYGEGKSLLVWFTRDRAARGDDATYLQLYRSDNDVVMERMFDAELADGIEAWRSVEILYDPGAEYIAVSVDGVLRIVYKTFFGRDSGATVSLRTLGGGGSFSDFGAWTE